MSGLNKNVFIGFAISTAFSMTSLLFALTLSWLVLASQNFMYPTWHDVGGIGEGIDRYGPKNKYKTGFGDTNKAQRVALFEQINRAVHRSGKGLAEIEYQTPSSRGPQKLLRIPEIVHLKDVAILIDTLKWAVVVNTLLLFVILFFVFRLRRPILKLSAMCLGVGAVVVFGGALVFSIGPEKVFNQLHIWVFPKDHQWFFYYQDSLMSTLMMAPTLFGWIAGAILTLALLFWGAIVAIVVKIEKQTKK